MPPTIGYRPFHKRNLPHFQPEHASFFITFCLSQSLRRKRSFQWAGARKGALQHEHQNGVDQLDWLGSDSLRIEQSLDRGENGPLWLADDRTARIVSASMHFRDGKVYRLDPYTIMPNHVHLLITPLTGGIHGDHQSHVYSLSSILHSLKRYTAREVNRVIGRKGTFWQHESYDHCVRDEVDWYRIVSYIINNPVRAGFVDDWRMWQWTYLRQAEAE